MKQVFLLGVCALGLAACEPHTDASASKVQFSVTSSETPVIAEKSVAPMRKVVRPQPPAGIYAGWHADLTSGCADGGNGVRSQYFDVNGDGLPDRVCWQTVHSDDYGDFVQVMAQVDRLNGDRESAYIILAANDGRQAALCNAGGVSVKQTLWARGEAKGVDGGFNGPIAITLTDGKCGPVSLFWPSDAGVDEARFTLLRI